MIDFYRSVGLMLESIKKCEHQQATNRVPLDSTSVSVACFDNEGEIYLSDERNLAKAQFKFLLICIRNV